MSVQKTFLKSYTVCGLYSLFFTTVLQFHNALKELFCHSVAEFTDPVQELKPALKWC
jgi:hypothetical protein